MHGQPPQRRQFVNGLYLVVCLSCIQCIVSAPTACSRLFIPAPGATSCETNSDRCLEHTVSINENLATLSVDLNNAFLGAGHSASDLGKASDLVGVQRGTHFYYLASQGLRISSYCLDLRPQDTPLVKHILWGCGLLRGQSQVVALGLR